MILFVCVHNAGRSVMAEAFARAAGIEAASAGTVPGMAPHAVVVDAMNEVGLDVGAHRGVLLTDEMVSASDRVITMCEVDADVCPAIRHATVEHWDLPDPKGLPIDEVRKIRDEIRARVESLTAGPS